MQQFYVWKLFDRVLAPFEQSYVELAAFLGLCLLATAALVVRRRRQMWRFIVQLVSLIVFFLVVSSCLGVFGLIRNAFLGLKLLSQQDDLSAFYWLSMTVVALGATFVGGAVFCGWICPTGTLQEWAGWLARRLRGTGLRPVGPVGPVRPVGLVGLVGPVRPVRFFLLWCALVAAYLMVAYRVFGGRRPILEDSATLWAGSLSVLVAIVLLAPRHSAALKSFRMVSLVLILGFTAAGVSVFSPVHFIFMNVQDWASLLSALVIVGAAIFVARAWCRYLCPFGLLCGWAARHAIFQIETDKRCTSCGVCAGVCEVEAIRDGQVAVSDCIACMKCVDRCPEGALALVARPFGEVQVKSPTSRAGLIRTGAVLGLVLAVVAGRAEYSQADSLRHESEILWNGFRGDPAATAWRSFEMDRLTTCPTVPASWTFRGAGVVWNYEPGVSVWSSPAIAEVGGRVVCFVGSYDHNVYALDAATGRELWRYPTGNGVYSTPAVARLDGRDCVLAASSDRTLYCLDAEKGIKLWAYEVYEWRQSLGRAFLSSPIVVFGPKGPTIIIVAWVFDTSAKQATEQAEVVAVVPEGGTGRLLWRRRFAESRPTHPVVGRVGDQTRIYVGCRDGNLYCLDGNDGSEIWRRTSKFPVDGTPALVGQVDNLSYGHGSLVLVGSEFGDIRAFDADSGDRAWSFKTGHWVQSTPAIVSGSDGKELAIFGSYDGRVYCLDARTGRVRWRYATRGNVAASATVVPRGGGVEVFVPSDDDVLHAIDGRNGRGLWQFSPGAFLWAYRGLGDTIWESPAAVRIGDVDMLIVPFYDGRIHAYRLDRSAEWLPRTGDPAYGAAMLKRIGASMAGTLLLALFFMRARRPSFEKGPK